jgi:Spy/CpxP family protein refolding chaperone
LHFVGQDVPAETDELWHLEDSTMRKHSMWLMAGAISAFILTAGLSRADENKNATGDFHQQWLDAAARKLALSDQQKQEIRDVQTECKTKAEPLFKQMASLKHAEHQAMKQLLSADQVKKIPETLRNAWDKECQHISAALDLSEEQKQRIEKIKEEYRPKFHELYTQQGEKMPERMHELKYQCMTAFGNVLNEEQRVRFPFVLHQEMRRLEEPATREQCEKEITESLGLSAEQKDQVHKIAQQYQPKVDKLLNELNQHFQDEQQRMDKVLTAEQRTKLQELSKAKTRQ